MRIIMPRTPGTKTYQPSRDWWQRSAATTAAEAVKPAPFAALTEDEVARILLGLRQPTLDDVATKVCSDVLRSVGA
jgi:hypothetical protein